ncbi:MAG: hypothetical protein AAFN92_16955, partial [Bacteroidota bacterium]
ASGARQTDIDTALSEARLFTVGANLDAARFSLIKAVKDDQCATDPSLPLVANLTRPVAPP